MTVYSLKDFIAFLRGNKEIILTEGEKEAVNCSRRLLEILAAKRKIYGVNTGVGAMLNRKIKTKDTERFQKQLILDHAAGVGKPLDKNIVLGALFLLINNLKKGYSGIRLETLEFLIQMFNTKSVPVVPETGSLGASGDLVPLAHLVLPLAGGSAADFIGLSPPRLQAGEALALINGTHISTSILALLVYESEKVCGMADLAASLTTKALHGNINAFRKDINNLKLHKGQSVSAENLRRMIGVTGKKRFLQDGYSLRCAPQVHGAVRDAVAFAEKIVAAEINSVSSNPIIFGETGEICSAGNFHGQPLALAADFLAIALMSLASISERRIERLLNHNLSGLPPFLSKNPGVDSGLMMAQYTAAALNAKSKVLASPASLHSLPVSASQEDFVSLAATSGLKAQEILRNVQYVLAIEILCAAKALAFRKGFEQDKSEAARICRFILGELCGEDAAGPLSDSIEKVFTLIKNFFK